MDQQRRGNTPDVLDNELREQRNRESARHIRFLAVKDEAATS
jgi:hypothetical protein